VVEVGFLFAGQINAYTSICSFSLKLFGSSSSIQFPITVDENNEEKKIKIK
jgi:hypothetical protein